MVELKGLTSKEAKERLLHYGFNALPEKKQNLLIIFLKKFWGPIPWMLEIIILLELFLGKFAQAVIIGVLILFNALLSFFEEDKAKNALRLLRNKLEVKARVLRDDKWLLVSAQEIVPDDILRLRMGDIVPADVCLLQGSVQIDQSTITGESLPVYPSVGNTIYASAIVTQGEAYVKVIATGKKTFFGKTAEIMRKAKTPSHLERIIFLIVKSLVLFDIALIIFVFIYSLFQHISPAELLPFSLLLLVACVPVALPATYALATALGALELAKRGVLITRLSAIEEAAAMTVLCIDKTGTITKNSLSISSLRAYSPYTNADLLILGSKASEESTQDPFDLTILTGAKENQSKFSGAIRKQFIPFDSSRKCSEAIIQYNGADFHVLKGAPIELSKLIHFDFSKDLEALSQNGSRVLAVVMGINNQFDLIGLIAFNDPPRETSKEAIKEIHDLGIKAMMITGDSSFAAKFIAEQVGIGSKIITKKELHDLSKQEIAQSDVISEVFPEDKYNIITLLQNQGYICGMTGDGVNDAPALKAAEVGIAVSSATDVAKAASSLVLTSPGLVDIVEAIKSSRRIYQRMLTYTLNKIIKTLQISVLLGLGIVFTNNFIISQLLIVLLLFANDFVTMSLATDNVSFSQKPDKWDIKKLMITGGIFAFLVLGLSFLILYAGISLLQLSIEELRTWIFLTLVFSGQAIVYLVRERSHFWHSMPSKWMILSSLLDVVIISIMAVKGFLMAQISIHLILGLLITVLIYFIFLDFLKVKMIHLFKMEEIK